MALARRAAEASSLERPSQYRRTSYGRSATHPSTLSGQDCALLARIPSLIEASLNAHPSLSRPCTLFWFRNDLRIHDNRALFRASANAQDVQHAALYALFVISSDEWTLHDMAPVKADLILRSLLSLRASLDTLNVPLIVLNASTGKCVSQSVLNLCQKLNVSALYFNYEYEIDESLRDRRVKNLLNERNITVHGSHDQCVVDPGVLNSLQGNPCSVYSPFKNAWFKAVEHTSGYLSLSPNPKPNPSSMRNTPLFHHLSQLHIPDSLPAFLDVPPDVLTTTRNDYPAGETEALARLRQFVASKVNAYNKARDFPHLEGTSRISAYLSLGVLSPRQCIAQVREWNNNKLTSGNDGCVRWVQEIIWRDFYRHVLRAFPRVCKYQPFKPETENIQWKDDAESEENFQKWCRGETGYPIVDAAMRQLNGCGWMHNRLRMVTAMFLSKDLLIDWRKGERYFMQHLIDGELASNNGGWQWAASTGTDAQPYFRVLNPLLQSQRFDAKGDFIRKWVPELASVTSPTAIHDPVHHLSKSEFQALAYPKPIVDHKYARERAINEFKRAYAQGTIVVL